MTPRNFPASPEDRLELRDRLAQLDHLFFQLRAPEACEPSKRHVQDVRRLNLREGERLCHERVSRSRPIVGPPDRGDDGIEHLDRPEQPFDYVRAVPRLSQAVLRSPSNDLDLMVDVVTHSLGEVQGSRHPVHECDHVDPETRLHRSVFVQVVQHDVGIRVTFELDHEPRLAPCRVVLGPADALELTSVHEVCDFLLDRLDRGLIGEFGDDYARGAPRLLDLGDRTQLDRALPCPVGIKDALAPQDRGAGGKIGPFDEPHELVGTGIRMLEHMQRCVDHLTQVVRRDVGGHTHRDPLGAVYEEVREPGGQDHGLVGRTVVVRHQVHGLFVDPGKQLEGQGCEPALGVPHGRRSLVGACAPEIPVTVDQGEPEAEVLHHAHQCVVDGQVTMGVIRTHDLAHDLGAFRVGPVGSKVLIVHRVEDPAVDRLQPVPHVGQGPLHDDGHRVLEERALHLLLDLDRFDRAADGLVAIGSERRSPARSGAPLAASVPCPTDWHVILTSVRRSDVEETDVFGICLDEVAPQLDVVTHEDGADLVGYGGLLDGDLQQGALPGPSSCRAARRSPFRPGPSVAGSPACGPGALRGTPPWLRRPCR